MKNKKCPKCSADVYYDREDEGFIQWKCDTFAKNDNYTQGDQCRIRQLEAEVIHLTAERDGWKKHNAINNEMKIEAQSEAKAAWRDAIDAAAHVKMLGVPSAYTFDGGEALRECRKRILTLEPGDEK